MSDSSNRLPSRESGASQEGEDADFPETLPETSGGGSPSPPDRMALSHWVSRHGQQVFTWLDENLSRNTGAGVGGG